MPSQVEVTPPGGVAAAKSVLAPFAADAGTPSASPTPEPNVPARTGSADCKASSASSAEVVQLEGGDVSDCARTAPPGPATVVLTAALSPTRLTVKLEPRAEQPHSCGSPQPEEQRQEHATLADDDQELRVVIDAKERLRWSPQLHSRFCQAVAELGGCAFAKPKDIVTKMNVPGLTLAHVKSHLQKYRQQEGVTYVPHGPRGGWGRRSSPAQQAAIAGCSNAYGDWQEGPAPKRMRTVLPAFQAPAPAAAPAAAAFSSAAGLWPAVHPAAPQLVGLGGAAAEPLQQYIKAMSSAAAAAPPMPPPMPAPMPAPAAEPETAAPPSPPAHEAHAARLHLLADLALAQQQELAEADLALQAEAAAVESAQEQLAGSAAAAAGELAQRVGSLSAEQQAVAADLQRHLAAHSQLLARLTGLRRTAQELLAHPELAPPPAPAAPAAPAAAEAAVQPAAPAAPAGPALPPGTDLNSLLAMVAAAAAGFRNAQPAAAPPQQQLPAAAGLAQLQRLYQNAALLAAHHG